MGKSRHHQAFLPCPAPLVPLCTLPVCPGVQVQLSSGLPRHKNGGVQIPDPGKPTEMEFRLQRLLMHDWACCLADLWSQQCPFFPFLSACQRRACATAAWWSVSVGSMARGSCVSVRVWSRGFPAPGPPFSYHHCVWPHVALCPAHKTARWHLGSVELFVF